MSAGPAIPWRGDDARRDGPTPRDAAIVLAWRRASRDPLVAGELEAIYEHVAREVARRGPACWASGRCCNFARAGHRLYVTGLEAAYVECRLVPGSRLAEGAVAAARACGGCPFQEGNLCGVHAARPLGCRVYFCDRSSFAWQGALTEAALADVRALHDRHALPYRYGEWREMLELLACHPER